MNQQKVLELALEALSPDPYKSEWVVQQDISKAITAIKEALAQPEQEPVGKFAKFTDGIWREVTDGSAGVPLYTTPPQRTWVGLTDEDDLDWGEGGSLKDLVKAIENKLKEKNR